MTGKKKSLIGMIFGEWRVIEESFNRGNRPYWHRICSCGNEKDVDAAELKRGGSTCCGHNNKRDLTGQRFGEWTVLYSSRLDLNDNYKHYWMCECSCGETKEVAHGNLCGGVSKSCGCVNNTLPEISKGMKFEEWEIIGDAPIRKNRSGYWLCRCSCGIEKYVEYKSLIWGTSVSCGHLRDDGIYPGMKFGKLTIIEFSGRDKRGSAIYKCLCECGNEKEIVGSHFKFGSTSSCGCYRGESSSERMKKSMEKNTKTRHGYSWYFLDSDNVKINCKSSYEVFFWNYFYFIKNTSIQYEPKTFIISPSSRYTPDFYFPDSKKWVETKGSFAMYEGVSQRQEENIKIVSKIIDIDILFWKDIVKICELEFLCLGTYFNKAKKLNIPIEDYLAEMQYLT